MADVDPNANADVEPGQATAPPAEPPQPPPTPPAAPEGIDENERKTWEGRLKAEQAEKAQLAEQNELLKRWYLEHQQGQTPPAQSEPEPEFDPYDRTALQKLIATEVEKGTREFVGQLMPILDTTLNDTASMQVKEWNDIRDGVLQSAKDLGITSLTQLKSNPKLFEKLVDAERYQHSLKNPPAPPAPTPEPGDRDALIAAGLGAGSGSAPAIDMSEYEFTNEEREYMTRNKMTEAQYVELVGGPAKIKIGGKA